ncbi:hypothetical protein Fmac_003538 [Flemingia macrophylla]|uniref:Serine carboxypeptidase-like 18 n=1 Tax=Flemingia macrophylla TaxID=520843 RepID=A0ABD1NNS5_9FABA
MKAAGATLAANQQYLVTRSKCMKMLWGLILVFTLCSPVASNTIVKTLPGFLGELPFLLETGYIGVGELNEIQLFYYFIESEGRPSADPLVLWLNGGPGCSALSGLMYEIGPISFDYERSIEGNKPVLVLNEYSWTKVANIIFLDAPVGTGFSYAETSAGYNTSDTKSTTDIYMFLRKWLVAHPKFQKNPVYIAGDSYSGIPVPVIVKKISDDNKAGNLPLINLKGYVLGNPLTDRKLLSNSRIKFAHRVGLLSDQLYEETKLDCDGKYVYPNKSETRCIEDLEIVNLCLKDINLAMVLEPSCSLNATINGNRLDLSADGFILEVNPTPDALLLDVNRTERWCRNNNYVFISIWSNDKEVQDSLHVRRGTIQEWERCNWGLRYVYDIMSVVDYHRNFSSEDLRALIYSDGEWRPWFVDGQVVGYTERYEWNKYNLTFATVKGGGHTAPEYKPKECLAMMSRWLAYHFL